MAGDHRAGHWRCCTDDAIRPAADASFLAGLSSALQDRLIESGSRRGVQAGHDIFPPRAEWTRAGVVESGIARAYLAAGDGRMFTIRYARPGELIGGTLPLSGGRAPLGIAAVTHCDILEFEVEVLRHAIESDVTAADRVMSALSHRLEDSYATLAAHAFGTMIERVAGHLLDLAQPTGADGQLVASVTQQQLADAVGTVREVVARALQTLRSEDTVATAAGAVVILDPARLASRVGRWHSADKEHREDVSSPR